MKAQIKKLVSSSFHFDNFSNTQGRKEEEGKGQNRMGNGIRIYKFVYAETMGWVTGSSYGNPMGFHPWDGMGWDNKVPSHSMGLMGQSYS